MIHHNTVSHLLRRGLAIASSDQGPKNPLDILRDNLSGGGAAILILTILVFVLLLSSVRYTLLGVVATLAQVEQPERSYMQLDSHAQAPKPSSDPASDAPPPYDPEVVMIQQPAITSSIRGTLRHISMKAGFTARWRGLACAVCTLVAYQLCYNGLGALLHNLLPLGISSLLTGVITSIILARWTLAWTHIVISEPSTQYWFRRIPSFSTWRKIWAPTAINAVAAQLVFVFPMLIWYAFGLNDAETLNALTPVGALWKFMVILLVALVIYIGIVLPSEVALTRCQASLLPDEDESIVPFDRSYGGKVVPAIVGGSGMLSYVDAWKSFDRASRMRIVKLYLKIFAIDIALHLLFGIVLALQLHLMLGSAAEKVGKEIQDGQGAYS